MPRVAEWRWSRTDDFVGRTAELERLASWWSSADPMPISLYGRRRVGKSWLVRRFAHGRPAVILVADRLAEGAQLARFAAQLAPALGGIAPEIPDVAGLFRLLHRLASEQQVLVVVDEFPWLLGTSAPEAERTLSAIQAVMEEERDSTRLKLILCGSAVAQMEALASERSPLHGRLVPLELRPLTRAEADPFLTSSRADDRFVRFAISGGMPRYLAALGTGELRARVCDQLLRPDAPLWNEGRTIVGQELREPAVHFALLERIARGGAQSGELADVLRTSGSIVSRYLAQLVGLRLIRRDLPFGAPASSRGGHWLLEDPFLRFWFRFVFPFQADLEGGLDPAVLFDAEIAPQLADHVAPVFEDLCRDHVRRTMGTVATRVGRWWGGALDEHRRSGERSSEEIDLVGTLRGRVSVVGEVRWTARPMSEQVLDELWTYKVPALTRSGLALGGGVTTVLVSRSGFTGGLRARAAAEASLVLLGPEDVLGG